MILSSISVSIIIILICRCGHHKFIILGSTVSFSWKLQYLQFFIFYKNTWMNDAKYLQISLVIWVWFYIVFIHSFLPMSKCSYLWWYSMRLLFCFYTFAFSKCFAMDRFYLLTTISFKIMPCKIVQITSFTVTVLWWLLVIPSREQATVLLTILVTEHLSFFPAFTRSFHGDPTPCLG